MVPAALEGGGEYMRDSDAGPTPPDSISSTLIHWAYLGDVHSAEQIRCESCGGIIEKTEATCPHYHSGNESHTTV